MFFYFVVGWTDENILTPKISGIVTSIWKGSEHNLCCVGSHGVMVSILDFESRDPSLNLGGTSFYYFWHSVLCTHYTLFFI